MEHIIKLFNESSEAFKNAMEQYIRYIGIVSSIRNLDIESQYQEKMFQYKMITQFEINKQAQRMSLLMEKERYSQNIRLQIYNSLSLALTLIEFSISAHNEFGIRLGNMMINSILKFVSDNKSNIQIPMEPLQSRIMAIQSNLTGYGYQNIDLINALNQLLMV